MNKLMIFGALAAVAGCCTFCEPEQEPNTLSEKEKAEGWQLLWDGKTSAGWVGVKSKCTAFPDHGWTMKKGVLTVLPRKGISNGKWIELPPEDEKLGGGGDICTEKKFRDFMFKFDFRLTDSANSGVKYFYDQDKNKGTCEEYQILDKGHPDWEKGEDGNRRVASLYDLIPANAEKVCNGIGEWNTGSRYKFSGRLADERFKYIEKRFWRNEMNHLDYGVRLRVGITKFAAIYGQYRISNILKKDKFANDLPKWEIGIQIF